MIDENGLDHAADWFYWMANTIVAIPPILISLHMLRYNHHDGKFGRQLSTLNVAATSAAVLYRLIIFFYPHFCAFYLTETTYFLCEFNLFHFRISLFYQSDIKFYERLYHLALIVNFVNTIFNVLQLLLNVRIPPLQYGCRSVPNLAVFTVAVPIFAAQLYMLVLGFYTIQKFWSARGEDARRKMRILWLVQVTFFCNFGSALFLLFFTGTDSKALLAREAFQFFNKSLSVFLAFSIYLKVRERGTTKKGFTTTQNSTTKATTTQNSMTKDKMVSKMSMRDNTKEDKMGKLPGSISRDVSVPYLEAGTSKTTE